MNEQIRQALAQGLVIPAHPLALDADGRLDERHQRALTRYYVAAGAGGLAVGVHTTQFAIRDAAVGLFEPVLSLARDEMDRADRGQLDSAGPDWRHLRPHGTGGPGSDAAGRPRLPRGAAQPGRAARRVRRRADRALPARGRDRAARRLLPAARRRRPSARLRVLAAVRGDRARDGDQDRAVQPLSDARRDPRRRGRRSRRHRALHRQRRPHRRRPRDAVSPADARRPRWSAASSAACWGTGRCGPSAPSHCLPNATRPRARATCPAALLRTGVEVTDCNAAVFDAANAFHGCIAGIHEVLRRQGLLASTRTLTGETLGPGQADELDRVCRDVSAPARRRVRRRASRNVAATMKGVARRHGADPRGCRRPRVAMPGSAQSAPAADVVVINAQGDHRRRRLDDRRSGGDPRRTVRRRRLERRHPASGGRRHARDRRRWPDGDSGLIDSHVHALGVAAAEEAQPFQNLRSIAEMQEWIRHAASAAPAGDWIWTPRVFPTRIREQRFPTRAELDAAAPNHPVVVDGAYALMVNSAAPPRGVDRRPARRILRAAPSSRAAMAARQACCATWARCSRSSGGRPTTRRRRSTRSSACMRPTTASASPASANVARAWRDSASTRPCARRAACTCARR